MKVLLTGASGLLGRDVFKIFKTKGIDITGLCFSRPMEGLVQVDITDDTAMENIMNDVKPGVVIHSAAQRFPDQMDKEPEKSWKLNVDTTKNLATLTNKHGARFIYISTDYVFAGDNPPYFADSETKPTNVYGLSKLEGEKMALINNENVVLRVPVLYGDVQTLGESAITSLLDTVRNKKPVKISSYEKRHPAHTQDIGNILLDMTQQLDSLPGGVYQWSGLEKISKWDIVQLISTKLDLPIDHIQQIEGPSTGGVARPRDVQMDRSKLTDRKISHHTEFATGYMKCIQQFV